MKNCRLLFVPISVGLVLCGVGCTRGLETEPVTTRAAASYGERIPEAWPFGLDAPSPTGENAMVATNAELATRVGVELLQTGGNAVDAAVASAFALAVVHPLAGNLGGGGFLVLRTASGETAFLDFRETAPLASTREMFLDEEGSGKKRSRIGHLSVAVPGTVAGLWEVHRRFGRRPWKALIAPAVRLSEEGFAVPPLFSESVRRVAERLAGYPGSAALFLPGGEPPAVGTIWRNPDLAATLRRIGDGGPAGFYAGETADLLVAEMRRGGGIITHEDLTRYGPRWREPVSFDYRGHRILSAPPPSSGGLVLALLAKILEPYDLEEMGWHSPATLHLMTEAMRRGFAARNRYLGDPDFVEIPWDFFLSPESVEHQRATISLDRATPSSALFSDPGDGSVGGSTTHLSVVDPEGNAVALTTTLNTWYGSGVTVTGGGFLLNNEMDDFVTRPGRPNVYGLVHWEVNAIVPGKRMLSSLAPTIVLDPDGDLFMVLGAAGGPRIISAIFQVISNVIDYGMGVTAAVNAPRIHHQHLPDRIQYEPDGLPGELVRVLEARGHTVSVSRGFLGYAPTILQNSGSWGGSGEPRRKGGLALGY